MPPSVPEPNPGRHGLFWRKEATSVNSNLRSVCDEDGMLLGGSPLESGADVELKEGEMKEERNCTTVALEDLQVKWSIPGPSSLVVTCLPLAP